MPNYYNGHNYRGDSRRRCWETTVALCYGGSVSTMFLSFLSLQAKSSFLFLLIGIKFAFKPHVRHMWPLC